MQKFANAFKLHIVALMFTSIFLPLSASATPVQAPWLSQLAPINDAFVIETPDGNHDFIIKTLMSARRQIQMSIYHLTDPAIIDALVTMQSKGVQVQVILDNASLMTPHYQDTYKKLHAGHVEVIASSPLFRITHSKLFIVDSSIAFVSTMNLVEHFMNMRDYGVFTKEPSIVHELQRVFIADVANARHNTMITPPLQSPNLVWSPVNSEAKLVDLIDSSKSTLELTSENLGDPKITDAIIRANARSVSVRIITPACDLADDPWRNYPFLRQMAATGVGLRLMPSPSTPAAPYMHAKTMIVDRKTLFIGSENLSVSSLLYSREVGIVFQNPKAIQFVGSTFERDWQASIAMPTVNPACPHMP